MAVRDRTVYEERTAREFSASTRGELVAEIVRLRIYVDEIVREWSALAERHYPLPKP